MAVIGLYAVVSNSVARRTQELGVRIALGASRRDIVDLVIRQGMAPLIIGLTLGLFGSFVVHGILQSALVDIPANDSVTLLISAAALITASVLGCLIPARRAMRVDPLVALQQE